MGAGDVEPNSSEDVHGLDPGSYTGRSHPKALSHAVGNPLILSLSLACVGSRRVVARIWRFFATAVLC